MGNLYSYGVMKNYNSFGKSRGMLFHLWSKISSHFFKNQYFYFWLKRASRILTGLSKTPKNFEI